LCSLWKSRSEIAVNPAVWASWIWISFWAANDWACLLVLKLLLGLLPSLENQRATQQKDRFFGQLLLTSGKPDKSTGIASRYFRYTPTFLLATTYLLPLISPFGLIKDRPPHIKYAPKKANHKRKKIN
jgi:hypothetical protein